MTKTEKLKIYENSEILKRAISKTLSPFKGSADIIIMNISYSNGQESNALYSGMKYIVNLRAEKKDNSPAIFYGFESLKNLKKKPEASILNSPAVEYIQIPFRLSELRKRINKVTGQKITEEPLDEKTAHSLAMERLSGVKHDLKNATILLNQHIQGLKSTEDERKREKWNTLAEFGDDFITKRAQRYNKVKDVIEGSFLMNRSIRQVPGLLKKAEEGFKSLKTIIKPGNYTEGKLSQIIKKGEGVVALVRKIETILEKVQHAR